MPAKLVKVLLFLGILIEYVTFVIDKSDTVIAFILTLMMLIAGHFTKEYC